MGLASLFGTDEIAKITKILTDKWNPVAEKLVEAENLLLPILPEVRAFVGKLNEIADIILDRKETP